MADIIPPWWRTLFHADGGHCSILIADTGEAS
jgi:hypothetical protein